MKPFDFVQPASVDDAIAAWTPGAAFLGGGTNLVDLMKTGALAPDTLIDITRLTGLSSIDVLEDGTTRIGALVRNADLADDASFARRYPMVAEALLSGASGQLRNAATVAGNIMQHPRAAYFHGPASDPAVSGSLSVLGAGDALAYVHPSDFCVPLAALDAVVETKGPNGAREIALADLYTPGETRTVLEPGELLLALRLPAHAAELAEDLLQKPALRSAPLPPSRGA